MYYSAGVWGRGLAPTPDSMHCYVTAGGLNTLTVTYSAHVFFLYGLNGLAYGSMPVLHVTLVLMRGS
jgi:hypothetical protein